ncbi:hypothetical protein N7510_001410 [Penicillium lagena]|uniref:uncharacterized protein n=1 Tax=Penicillium lagena TaxID=94218 RepID=UPI002541D927|nr:uncharacterized protein N7510_001410 [Penicillium lagena]KAJ5625101.1 hypothetical protein N7510_001410 [Penicillium lagena]
MKISFGSWFLIVAVCLARWASAATRYFAITLTWENRTVAGITRPMIHTNGQFPAPRLSLNQGDSVEFYVQNDCPFSVTVHFHEILTTGIEQRGTPWSDGTPGVSQRPIEQGSSFLYQWTADQYGAYFYHAHHRGQIDDGLYGPIYITPASSVERPFDLISNSSTDLKAMLEAEKNTSPIMLSDWKRYTSEQIWSAEEASGVDALCANALLINGMGSVTCFSQAEIASFVNKTGLQPFLGNETLTDLGCFPPDLVAAQGAYPHNYSALLPGMFYGCVPTEASHALFNVNPAAQYVSWDLTSSAGVLEMIFSVDEHEMYVYAIDGRYIEPQLADAVIVPNANRYSVMIPLNKPAGDYTIRVASASANQILNVTATMHYEAANKLHRPSNPWITPAGINATEETILFDESQVVPFPVIVPSTDVAATFILNIAQTNASYVWKMAHQSFNIEYEESQPLLFNQSSIPSDLYIRTKNNTWIDFILQVTTLGQPRHPIHKHSNKHFVIGQGNGTFNYSSVAEAMQFIPDSFNLKTPQYRDTSPTPLPLNEPTWLAIRYQVVNPGAFLMHCHIQMHQSGGMVLAILDGVDHWPVIPLEYRLDESEAS